MVRCRSAPKHEVSRPWHTYCTVQGMPIPRNDDTQGQIGHAGKASCFRAEGIGGALTRNKELQGQDAFLDIPTSVRK